MAKSLVIDFLLENKGSYFSKTDIVKGAEMSRATLFNYWPELEDKNIVIVTRSFGKTKLYSLNFKNPVVKKIVELERALIASSMDSVRKIEVLKHESI
jgi:predicted transcriptional regulator